MRVRARVQGGPIYSALSPMAAESAAMLGTMSSTSLTGSSHGALAETMTVEVSTSSSKLVSWDLVGSRGRGSAGLGSGFGGAAASTCTSTSLRRRV